MAAWDWRYFSEKIRQVRYDLTASELKPYFSLANMTKALFFCAEKLFHLKFVHVPNISSYHPDVQVYEVWECTEGKGDILRAIFLHDNFSRPNKQGGAWMSEYRSQTRNVGSDELERMTEGGGFGVVRDGSVIPVIVNNNNFNKAPEGMETLLSFDDAVTLFHEFGHGLHGMLSDVTYGTLAGTSVLKDFVELPSQLFEHWISEPQVLKQFARHVESNDAIPDALINKLKAARSFNCGFNTVEYLSSALVDQSLHQLPEVPVDFDVSTFEEQVLASIHMPPCMVMRHRPVHFLHLFSCTSYAAGYYVYLWAEVLDADAFDAFVESGDIFSPEVAARVRRLVLPYYTVDYIALHDVYRVCHHDLEHHIHVIAIVVLYLCNIYFHKVCVLGWKLYGAGRSVQVVSRQRSKS